jgi:hypothetical protein
MVTPCLFSAGRIRPLSTVAGEITMAFAFRGESDGQSQLRLSDRCLPMHVGYACVTCSLFTRMSGFEVCLVLARVVTSDLHSPRLFHPNLGGRLRLRLPHALFGQSRSWHAWSETSLPFVSMRVQRWY